MTKCSPLHIACTALLLIWPTMAFGAGETFGKDVAPILNRSCVTCHRPGEAAPMSLIGYENVRLWARSIRQKVTAREMPPWAADPSHSVKFQNDPTLSPAEIDLIARWVDGGALKGNDPIPAPPTFAEGWSDSSGRRPDYVLTLPVTYAVPAESSRESARMLNPTFYVKVPFDSDKWIRAAQARPDQRTVVHYMDLNVVEFPAGTTPPGADGQAGGAATQAAQEIDFLTANFRPGAGYESFPAGSARRLPSGSNRYFQITMHYQPSGTAVQDRSSFGFWFSPTAPAAEIVKAPVTAGVVTADGKEVLNANVKRGPTLQTKVYYPTVPANTARFEVTSVQPITVPTTIYELMPHAHNRATDFKYTLVFPDGREQVLLTVPKYSEDWQFGYLLTEPITVPAGSKIVVVAHYDNSTSNRTVTTPSKPGSDMFMPTMQSSVERGAAAGVP